ncbi:hypothetical protein [Rhizobium sp.]|jgi:hypothetical protein|uniref:hypothetical protein n=1 Tax=Rhizobium sp. TaxID=391 RepID=UPI000E8E979E|nr:hypothetical protein [Rhizobium sp.]
MVDEVESHEAASAATSTTFVPSISFRGYPDGITEVHFSAGVESAPVSPEFAALMRAKGLVSDSKTTNEAAAS